MILMLKGTSVIGDQNASTTAAAKPAVRIMYGAAIMFFAAACVEAFWSPITEVPFNIKIVIGVSGWVALLAYFLFAGRGHASR